MLSSFYKMINPLLNNGGSISNKFGSTLFNDGSTINNNRSTLNLTRSALNNNRSTINLTRSPLNNDGFTLNLTGSTLNNDGSTFSVSRTHSQDREDQAFGVLGVGYTHRTTTAANSCNNTLHRRASQSDRDRDRGTRSPAAASHGSGSSSLRMRAANRHAGSSSPPPRVTQASSSSRHGTLDHPRSDSRLFDPNGVDTVSNADGGMTPGSAFDASEIDRLVLTFFS